MPFADDALVYRDLDGPWGHLRLVVGGTDLTLFRGKPAQIAGYQLTEPYGYGPADFNIPTLTSLEVDGWGAGDLTWMSPHLGMAAQLLHHGPDGSYVGLVWEGIVTSVTPTLDGTELHCDGKVSGKLALRDRHPRLFRLPNDVGALVYNALTNARIPSTPALGLETGIEVDAGGISGTLLSYVDELLTLGQTQAGAQLTVMPNAAGVMVQQWKDRDTIHATVFNGAHGVRLEPTRDLAEEPTTIYGSGRRDDGMLWGNYKYPGLEAGPAPTFPGTLSLGDSGEDVETLQYKLIGMQYLDRDEALGGFNVETEEAVKDLQKDAGLSRTGVVNSATWSALFNLADTGLSLRQAWTAPLAQLDEVRRYDYTSNGSRAGDNALFDPLRVEVDRTLEFGICGFRRAVRWSENQIDLIQTEPNWAGTLTLTADVFAGSHTHGDTPTPMSRLDLRAGMNIMVRNFGETGSTLFHISGAQINADLTVTCAIDTKARNLLELGQIIERNRASRRNPAREWLQQRRSNGAHQQIVQWHKQCGLLDMRIELGGDEWTVFPVVGGQSGSIEKIRVKLEDNIEFAVVITAEKVGPAWLADKIGNPFAGRPWVTNKIAEQIDRARVLLYAAGTEDEPCGYFPGTKAEGDPLTGLHVDAGGFDYHTFGDGALWIGVYPKSATVMKPQRVLWGVMEAGM